LNEGLLCKIRRCCARSVKPSRTRTRACFTAGDRTSAEIPSDALNVGLVGDEEDVVRAMNAEGWFAADPVTLSSSIQIVSRVALDRPSATLMAAVECGGAKGSPRLRGEAKPVSCSLAVSVKRGADHIRAGRRSRAEQSPRLLQRPWLRRSVRPVTEATRQLDRHCWVASPCTKRKAPAVSRRGSVRSLDRTYQLR
jgi:hypothetical protein